MTQVSIPDVVARWDDPATRPLFKGQLIDENGCCCAQGDILRTYCGWDDIALYNGRGNQTEVDKEIADALGISLFQSVLLRVVNDRHDGCPQDVLRAPERVLGGQAPCLLAFGRHLDHMSYAAWEAAGEAARKAAGEAAWEAAREAAGEAAREAAGEIQGAAIFRRNGTPFFFLPMFGFADPKDILAADTGAAI